MQPYKDYRDIILEFILEHRSIAAGTGSGIGGKEQKPNLINTQIRAGVTAINHEFPNWVIVVNTGGGMVCHILDSYKTDVQAFLDKGGFTKIEYEKSITDEEKVKALREMKNEGSIDFTESDKSRLRKVLDALVVEEYAIEIPAGKGYVGYKCSDLGNRSALADRLLPNPANSSPSIVVNHDGDVYGPQAFGGNASQHVQGHGQIGNKVDSDNKTATEKDSLFDKILKIIKEKPGATLLLIAILILLLLVELFWPF